MLGHSTVQLVHIGVGYGEAVDTGLRRCTAQSPWGLHDYVALHVALDAQQVAQRLSSDRKCHSDKHEPWTLDQLPLTTLRTVSTEPSAEIALSPVLRLQLYFSHQGRKPYWAALRGYVDRRHISPVSKYTWPSQSKLFEAILSLCLPNIVSNCQPYKEASIFLPLKLIPVTKNNGWAA